MGGGPLIEGQATPGKFFGEHGRGGQVQVQLALSIRQQRHAQFDLGTRDRTYPCLLGRLRTEPRHHQSGVRWPHEFGQDMGVEQDHSDACQSGGRRGCDLGAIGNSPATA